VSHAKRYTVVLDFDMREQVRFVADGNDVLEFVVQLEIKIDDDWAWIRRYDTMNGVAHLDVKYGDGTIDKHKAMNLPFKEAFTVALGEIGSNWHKHRSWYLEGRRKR
jgi:hypothetical protein